MLFGSSCTRRKTTRAFYEKCAYVHCMTASGAAEGKADTCITRYACMMIRISPLIRKTESSCASDAIARNTRNPPKRRRSLPRRRTNTDLAKPRRGAALISRNEHHPPHRSIRRGANHQHSLPAVCAVKTLRRRYEMSALSELEVSELAQSSNEAYIREAVGRLFWAWYFANLDRKITTIRVWFIHKTLYVRDLSAIFELLFGPAT